MFSIKNNSNQLTFAEKAKAVVDATTGAFKAGAKAATIVGDDVTLQANGEDVLVFDFNSTDKRNDVSDLTADTTNKNERFSSTSLLVNGTSTLRVSQAFILQTAKHS